MLDFGALSASDLSNHYASGAVDPLTAIEQVLHAISTCDDPAIFTVVTADRALREARVSGTAWARKRPRSRLDGVPVAWKDSFALRGLTTTAGSKVLARKAATIDATAVARFAAAGAVTVGRVNMTEFAFSGIGINPHFGTPRNPHDPHCARIPGGSSSGSAVAVARGIVPISIGTDTSGSVRVPAALNGIVGYKATAGRYPMHSVVPLSMTLDSIGVLCRSVADALIVDALLTGKVERDDGLCRLEGLRIIVPTNVVFDGCEASVLGNFEAAIEQFAVCGASIERRAIPAFEIIQAAEARLGAIVNAEAYALYKTSCDGPQASEMDRRVVARMRLGAHVSADNHSELLAIRQSLIEDVDALLGNAIVAYPTVARTACPIEILEADDSVFVKENALMLRNTRFGNFLNWCGISLPTGRDRRGLPTAILLSGIANTDRRLLRLAMAYQSMPIRKLTN